MERGSVALAFRRAHPKYTGLLWSYHWLQMSLYDALMKGDEFRRAIAALPGYQPADTGSVHTVRAFLDRMDAAV